MDRKGPERCNYNVTVVKPPKIKPKPVRFIVNLRWESRYLKKIVLLKLPIVLNGIQPHILNKYHKFPTCTSQWHLITIMHSHDLYWMTFSQHLLRQPYIVVFTFKGNNKKIKPTKKLRQRKSKHLWKLNPCKCQSSHKFPTEKPFNFNIIFRLACTNSSRSTSTSTMTTS